MSDTPGRTEEASPTELTDLETVELALLGGDVRVETDPDLLQAEIIRRTLEEEDPERVFTPEEVRHARDLLGIPLQVRGVRWYPSSYSTGPRVYAVMDCVDLQTGERMPVTCGAARVLAQLYRAVKDQLLPIQVVIREAARPTSQGYYPLYLERWEPPQGGQE